MIKIKKSVISTEKKTYAHEEASAITIDCSDGINDILRPSACAPELAEYPCGLALQKEICHWWRNEADLSPTGVLLGNGSQQLLYLVNKLLVGPGSRVLGYTPQYSSYCSDVLFCGGQYRGAKTGDNYCFDARGLLRELSSDDTLVYLDNPNNPTGQVIPMEQLEAIVQAAEKKSVCVFVDEAYGDYMPRTASAITLVNKYNNLIVTRSFSKAFGLAGLRLGYLVARPYVIRQMKKLTTPYDGSVPARKLAQEVLQDEAFLPQLRERVKQQKTILLSQTFENLRIAHTDICVPILLLQHKRPDFELAEAFARAGLGIVSGRSFYGMGSNCVRLRVPNQENMQPVVRILHQVDQQR